MSIRSEIEQCYAAYANLDLPGAMSIFADNIKFDWPQNGAPEQFCGCCEGLEAMEQRLMALAEAFDYEAVNTKDILVDGNKAACQLSMKLRSKTTGETALIHTVHFWQFENGKCVEFTEYYDTALLDSLLK